MKTRRSASRRVRAALVETLDGRSLLSAVAVTSLGDAGPGTLRQAIADAAPGDTIDLTGLTGSIALNDGLTLDKSLTIAGPGRTKLTINGRYSYQIFHINDGVSATISGLSLENGRGYPGGGGEINAVSAAPGNQTLRLTDVNLYGGQTSYGNGGGLVAKNVHVFITDCDIAGNTTSYVYGSGGGISVEGGDLTMTGTTVSGNVIEAYFTNTGSGIAGNALGGGVSVKNLSSCSITDSTLFGNVARENNAQSRAGTLLSRGGGLYAEGTAVALTNVTIYKNQAVMLDAARQSEGGGLYLGAGASATLTNVVVADNYAGASNDMVGTNVTATRSLIGDATGSGVTGGANGNLAGTAIAPLDAMLSDPADNGGPTPTCAVLAGSPLVDAGTAAGAPALDQRGYVRLGQTDIGAYEYGATPPPPAPVFERKPRAYVAAAAGTAVFNGRATIDGDDGTLSYRWKALARPEGAAKPRLDGRAAKTGVAFDKAGTYTFRITATSADGVATSRTLRVTVDAVATVVAIKQHEQTFSSVAPTRLRGWVVDQFGDRIAGAAPIVWSMDEGAGSIDASSGLYTPAGSAFSHLVFRATSGTATGIAGNRLKRQA